VKYGLEQTHLHAEFIQLVVEELLAELSGEQRHVFDDGQPHPPFAVLCELDYRRKKRLRKLLDSDHLRATKQAVWIRY